MKITQRACWIVENEMEKGKETLNPHYMLGVLYVITSFNTHKKMRYHSYISSIQHSFIQYSFILKQLTRFLFSAWHYLKS